MLARITFLIVGFFLTVTPQLFYAQGAKLKGTIYRGFDANKEVAANVRVRAAGSSTKTSDSNGEFTLTWPQKPGSEVLLKLTKRGFKVINDNELKTLIPDNPDDPNYQLEIYLCPEAECEDLRIAYFSKEANLNLEERFDAKERALRKEVTNRRILAKKLDELDLQKQEAEKQIQSLAAEIARMNLAANPDDLNRAISLYQQGEVDSALSVLDPDTIISRINQRVDSVSKLHHYNQVDVNSLMRAADMAMTDGQFDRAESYLTRASGAEEEDFGSLAALCQFLVDQQKIKTTDFGKYTQQLKQRASTKQEEAVALQFQGMYWQENKDYTKAIEKYDEALAIRNSLIGTDSSGMAQKAKVAETLTNIGTTFTTLEKYDKSISKHKEAMSIQKELVEIDSIRYASTLAETYNYLGVIYGRDKKVDEAIKSYEEALKINRALWEIDSTDEQIRLNLSYALSNLSEEYRAKSRLREKAYATGLEALRLRRELVQKNPLRYGLNVIWSLKSMGRLYRDNDEHEEGLGAFQESVIESLKLQKRRPGQFDATVALNYSLLASYYFKQKQYEDADSSFRKSAAWYERLAETEPENYASSAATAYYNIGATNYKLKKYGESVSGYEKALAYRQELASDNPSKYGAAVKKAQTQLNAAKKKWESQPKEVPPTATRSGSSEASSLEENLAKKLQELGEIYLQMKNKEKASETYQQALAAYQSLAEIKPAIYEPIVQGIQQQLDDIGSSMQ
ncbi:MAG: tetratricopeptide repeat protein [Bacteroidota bacterium]